ncbi:MAG: hypothetical protein ACKPKO_04510, partial [Candidatus Fonsibacter sp.]
AADLPMDWVKPDYTTRFMWLHSLVEDSGLRVLLDFIAPWCNASAVRQVARVARDYKGRCLCVLVSVECGACAALEFA